MLQNDTWLRKNVGYKALHFMKKNRIRKTRDAIAKQYIRQDSMFWYLPWNLRRIIYTVLYPHIRHVNHPDWGKAKQGNVYSLGEAEKLGCIFVHIPRCGGVSVAKSLLGNLGGGHMPIREYMLRYPRKQFEDRYKFCFVRNPWDRLFSAFTFLQKGGFDKADALWAEEYKPVLQDFEYFVNSWLNEERLLIKFHFWPQYYFTHVKGQCQLDFVGRFERFDTDFQHICRVMNIYVPLAHVNASQHPANYQNYYTRQMVDRVAELYGADIAYFGYKFVSDTGE